MNITEKILGVPIEEVSLTHLKEFFSEDKVESNTFEVKSYYDRRQNNDKEKEKGILKSICAFLNSNGGLLIWGGPKEIKDQERGHKVFSGDLSPVPISFTKDSFISKIANRIIPLPEDVKFKSIQIDSENFVYLIEVKESVYKPHQFSDRYFIRLDGQTVIAPHYFIEALFRQVKFPNIGGYAQFDQNLTPYHNGYFDGTPITHYLLGGKFWIFNHSSLQNEEELTCTISLDKCMFFQPKYPVDFVGFNDNRKVTFTGFAKILHYGMPQTTKFTILVPKDEIAGQNLELKVLITYGGKNSPSKFSWYKLLLGLDNDNMGTVELILADEDKFMTELGDDNILAKERIEKAIGRKINFH